MNLNPTLLLAKAALLLLAGCGGASDNGDASPADRTADSIDVTTISNADSADVQPVFTADHPSDPDMPRIDYLTFAEGAVPLSVGGPGAEVGVNVAAQISWIDGDSTPFGFISTEDLDIVTEFTYELPAPTTFDRLAIPEVTEVPSAYTTFTRHVEVLGSAVGPEDGFVTLASATLETHPKRGQVTELPIVATPAVRWVKLKLQGGIENLADGMNFQFSEIIGNGTQEPRPLVDHFRGAWQSRYVKMEMVQEGARVSGCYDSQGVLEGTVDGNILRARGVDQGRAQTVSLFILSVLADSTLVGVRSTNGGPFRLYTGPAVEDVPTLNCVQAPPALGCGSVIHGVNFDFDSAQIRPGSETILAELFAGLQGDEHATIVIEGHTSSEGTEDYNQSLSERRARAVVDDLVRRGIDASRITASGKGEAEPIAPNSDENGRSLNRRVEVKCS
ncbi:MAG: OmpA family protein [Rhodothermales bacterium]